MTDNKAAPLSSAESEALVEQPALNPVVEAGRKPPRSGRPKTETIEIRQEEKGLEVSEKRFEFQKKSLNRIRKLFKWFNIALLGFVFIFALIEKIYPPATDSGYIITDKVIIGIIAGLTAQIGAIVLAAYKGLFSSK